MNQEILDYLREKYAQENPSLFDVGVSQSTAATPAVTPPPDDSAYTPQLTMADIGKSSTPGLEVPEEMPGMFDSDPFADNLSPSGVPVIPEPSTPAVAPPPVPAQAPKLPVIGGGGVPTPPPAPIAPPASNLSPSAPLSGPGANPSLDPNAGFTPADRAKVAADNAPGGKEVIGEALAGLGDSIARSFGNDRGSNHLEQTLAAVKARKEGALSNFDKQAALAKENYDTARQIIANNRADVDRAQLTDPSSPVSKAKQALLDKIEPGVDHSKINALQAEVLFNPMLEGYKISEQAKNRKMMTDYMMGKKDEDTGTKFEQEMNASKMRAGALGDNQKRLNASERVLNLIDQVKGNPNAMQTPELAQAVGSLISSGSGVVNQSQIEHLMPQSFKGNVNKFVGWLTNDPTGLGQQEFVKSFMHTAERERDLITRQMAIAQGKSASGYVDYIRRNPDKARAKLEAQGLPEPMIQKILSGDFKGLDQVAPTSAPPIPKMPTHDEADLPSFASEAEAEAANLKPGTIVRINGKRARID